MRKRLFALLLALLLLLCCCAAEEVEETQPAENAAPDFTFYDIDGNAHTLSEFQGKPVILNFWASWCGPCKSEMPDLEDAYQEYGEEVHFILVNLTDGVNETVSVASEYIAGQGYTFPVYYDIDPEGVNALAGAEAYKVSSIPITYFIDAQGNIVAYASGMMSASRLQSGIDMILEKEE